MAGAAQISLCGQQGMRQDPIGPSRVRLSSRRAFLGQVACGSLAASVFPAIATPLDGQQQYIQPAQEMEPAGLPAPSTLTPEDDQFLNDLEHANFLFFWEQANPDTGLIKDRCNVRTKDTSLAASIASVGLWAHRHLHRSDARIRHYEDARPRVLSRCRSCGTSCRRIADFSTTLPT